jgi:predicted secreted protein
VAIEIHWVIEIALDYENEVIAIHIYTVRSEIMKYISAILLTAIILAIPGTAVMASQSSALTASTIPTFVIKAVDRNDLVTIQTDNLRLNDTYKVTMGVMGTKGVNGIQVATIQTTDSGRVTKTFSIPSALKGLHQIAIRLQSPTTGYYAYNWFYNNDANLHLIGTPESPPSDTTPTTGYSGYPYFYITAVDKATSVTINEYNFPPNKTFNVRMNWMFTRGIAGTIVETVTSDASGVLSDTTYAIPDFLKNSYKIAIRLESTTGGYYAYNWFYNNDAP